MGAPGHAPSHARVGSTGVHLPTLRGVRGGWPGVVVGSAGETRGGLLWVPGFCPHPPFFNKSHQQVCGGGIFQNQKYLGCPSSSPHPQGGWLQGMLGEGSLPITPHRLPAGWVLVPSSAAARPYPHTRCPRLPAPVPGFSSRCWMYWRAESAACCLASSLLLAVPAGQTTPSSSTRTEKGRQGSEEGGAEK